MKLFKRLKETDADDDLRDKLALVKSWVTDSKSGTFDGHTGEDGVFSRVNGLPDGRVDEAMGGIKYLIRVSNEQLVEMESTDRMALIGRHCDHLERQIETARAKVSDNLALVCQELISQVRVYRAHNSIGPQSDEEEWRANAAELRAELNAIAKRVDLVVAKSETADGSTLDPESMRSQVADCAKQTRQLRSKIADLVFRGNELVLRGNELFLDDKDFLRNFLQLVREADFKPKAPIKTKFSRVIDVHKDLISQILYLPNGRLLSCSLDRRIWEHTIGKMDQKRKLSVPKMPYFSMTLLNKDSWLACGSLDIVIWSVKRNKKIRTLRGHTHAVISMAALKDGRLASYSLDDTIKIWRPSMKKEQLLKTIAGHGNTSSPCSMAVLSNEHLVTCSADADAKVESVVGIWDPNDDQNIKHIPTGLKSARALCVLADNSVIVGFRNGAIQIVDAANGVVLDTKERAHLGVVTMLAGLPDGRLLSAGGHRYLEGLSSEFKIWSMPAFRVVQVLETHPSKCMSSMAVSVDQKYLAFSSAESAIFIWPLAVFS